MELTSFSWTIQAGVGKRIMELDCFLQKRLLKTMEESWYWKIPKRPVEQRWKSASEVFDNEK